MTTSSAPASPEPSQSSPTEGLKTLGAAYFYWTGKITDISFQTCVALIAANWALYPKSGELIAHKWSLTSISFALSAVLASLIGAIWLANLHHARYYEAQINRAKWKQEWELAERTPTQWPFTPKIEQVGRFFSGLKVMLPLISGICFIVGAWRA